MVLPEDRYEQVLANLDALEGYDVASDTGLYLRRTCTVRLPDGDEVEAYIYLGGPRALRRFTDDDLVPDGDWVAQQRGWR
jgi:gamma-glutamylcyclotransferase (GGCT)/AIG2-like uncharacterized protein YtfP